MEKKRAWVIIIVFSIIIFGFAIVGIVMPDKDVSYAERRKLAAFPKFSFEELFSGDYTNDLEKYLLDQFPMRDDLRTVNAAVRIFGLLQLDNGGITIKDGSAFKIDETLDEKQVRMAAAKINEVCDTYLEGMNIYYAVIPDKSVFSEADRKVDMDYDGLKEILRGELGGLQEIEVWDELSVDDYYRTDPHWKQESVYSVALKISESLGVSEEMTAFDEYKPKEFAPFYGAYYGQAALPLKADTLTIMTSEFTEEAKVTGNDFEEERPVYSTDLFEGIDGYDVYLSGAQSLLTIEVPNAKSDKELIIFRDSYGSSIAPYFIGAYSKITLVDLRYMPAAMLGDYVEFENQDVLFMYSSLVLNHGALLK